MAGLEQAIATTVEQSTAEQGNYKPVRTLEELAELDGAEIMRGYWVGYDNEYLDQRDVSHSFWHGYLVGQTDAGHREHTEAQIRLILAHAMLRNSGMH